MKYNAAKIYARLTASLSLRHLCTTQETHHIQLPFNGEAELLES
jgi:hypothetical protein